jgi:hypothetical protein
MGLIYGNKGGNLITVRDEISNLPLKFVSLFFQNQKKTFNALMKIWIFSLVFFDDTAVLNGKATETLKFK